MSWASASNRAFGHGSTYSTSYGAGSTTYMPRNSSSRDASGIGGYTSQKSYGSSSRPLPSGPGPLDPSGKKLNNYSVPSRNRTPISTRAGPVKASHTLYNSSTVSKNPTNYDFSRHASITTTTATHCGSFGRRSSITNNPITGTGYGEGATNGLRSRPLSGSAGSRTPNKSTSLSDLSSLSLSDNSPTTNHYKGVSSHKERSVFQTGINANLSSKNTNSHSHHRDNNNNDDFLSDSRRLTFDDSRPDGTMRTRYTPSMSRESSPTNNVGLGRRVIIERGDSPPKSSASNQSSSGSMSMSNGISSKHRDGGKVGLRNLGNTCFMNSVLQCLSNTKLLLEYCLDEGYQRDINTTTSNMKGNLFKAYGSLMQSMWKERTDSSISPTAFKTQIQRFASRFMGYSQQDSQEFLRYLLEGLHEDVNRVTKKPAPIILDDDVLEKKNDNEKAIDYWKAYINRDNSQIVDIFVGQLKSELKFDCNHRSVTFDPFWDLSLPIPKFRDNVNIVDCIKLFMKEEELGSEELPKCQKCKQRRACRKMFSIHKFPKILVLHLKRFSQERYGKKLNTMVDFPIEGLDLSEYSAQGRGGRQILYDLYAVSNHSGGTSSGHYTAYCKNPYSSEWYSFSDSSVTRAQSRDAISQQAYVLFYELRSLSSKM